MKISVRFGFALFAFLFVVFSPNHLLTEAKEKKQKEADEYTIPNHVLDISKENTFPNVEEDQAIIEPSESTKKLIKEAKVSIENPDLIKMLNETTVKPSPIALGYRGMVFLGRWALHYDSKETSINWQFQKLNENELNNHGSDKPQKVSYHQEQQKEIKGALTNKITNPDQIKQMILLKTKEKTKLPLSYQTTIGKGTKKDQTYAVPTNKYGYLHAYAPAISEKGQVTFGEVYIQLKGSKKKIVIKNVTKQGIGAWIPLQDHVSFSFQLK